MIDFSKFDVVPACLPIEGKFDLNNLERKNFRDDIIGIRAHAVGWGRTTNDEFSPTQSAPGSDSIVSSEKQQFVDLPIISENQCLAKWSNIRGFKNEHQLCAGGED